MIDFIFLSLGYTITLVSIPIVIYTSIQKRPIGYKWICFFSIFISIYQFITLILTLISLSQLKQIDSTLANELASTYLLPDTIIAVSYTHLDVYKRQFKYGFKISLLPSGKCSSLAKNIEPLSPQSFRHFSTFFSLDISSPIP